MSIMCFDLDEVLVKYDIITQASRILMVDGVIDKIYTNKDITSWELAGIPEIVKTKTYELFSNPEYAVWKKKPIPGVELFLDYLQFKKHELHILTSRPECCHNDTYEFVKKVFGTNIKTTCVSDPGKSKLHNLAIINPDYYFDDNITFCEESRLLGINTYLISNEYTPWNHKLIHGDITRIKNVAFFPKELT